VHRLKLNEDARANVKCTFTHIEDMKSVHVC